MDYIKCLNRCRIHKNDADFINLVLNGYHNPNLLEIENRGNDYPGETVYEINEFGGYVGFFGELKIALLKLYFADRRGFTPYIYWGTDNLYHEEKEVLGTTNAFLYYFEPVSNVSDSSNAGYLIKAKDEHIDNVEKELNSKAYNISEEYYDALVRMLKKYIVYNTTTREYLQKSFSELIGDKKTLAVHFRGTDYRRQYNNHPIFVTAEEELEIAKDIFAKGEYEQIFLATDEIDAVELFKEYFGDRLVYYPDVYRASADGEGDSVAFSDVKRENHHYKLGLEVLRDQYTLSACDGLICGISNITLIARAMRDAYYDNPFEDLKVIDHGLNSNSNSFSKASH